MEITAKYRFIPAGLRYPATLSLLAGAIVTCPLGCRQGSDRDSDSHLPHESTSGLALLFAPGEPLEGAPNIFEFSFSFSGSSLQPVTRGGDLPAPGETITISNLPSAAVVTLKGGLYKSMVSVASLTHSCASTEAFNLNAGETTSISLTCTAVSPPSAAEPVQVFLKVAKGALSVTEVTSDAILATRDLSQPALFAWRDPGQRRISLKQGTRGLTFAVGGEVTFSATTTDPTQQAPQPRSSLLASLIAGDTIRMQPLSGRLIAATANTNAELRLTARPVLFESQNGSVLLALPVSLASEDGNVMVQGTLYEEPAGSEFTVVSYNVENLFDLADDDRNSHYGDFRITPNDQGKVSNWGEPVMYNGELTSYTAVKIDGIRRALLALDPDGPEIVGFTEVESRAALEMLFHAVRDLGYTHFAFSDWPAGTEPTAIGMGYISKYPFVPTSIIPKAPPPADPAADTEAPRPVLKGSFDILGKELVVYLNHWKSKGGPESMRIVTAKAVEDDIKSLSSASGKPDYIIMGDLNSHYNEKVVIEPGHNDTNGITGINDVIKAQGDELAVLKGKAPSLKYNLHYELDRGERRTAWHQGFNWSSLDHIIIGAGMYDQSGLAYIDNSFVAVNANMPSAKFLFRDDGTTRRWDLTRLNSTVSQHNLGGFSDHVPIFARFHIPVTQSTRTVYLSTPGVPDKTDLPLSQ